jgi:hypothetical protein
MNLDIESSEVFFSNMSSGVVFWQAVDDGDEFSIFDMNASAQEQTGVDIERVRGLKGPEVYTGLKSFPLYEAIKRVWRTGEREHLDPDLYQDPDLEGFFECEIFKLPTGLVAVIFRDVTEFITLKKENKRLKKGLSPEKKS